MANDVINTGRSEHGTPVATASSMGMPSLRSDRVNSTIRMLFETTIPVIMMTPINDMTLTVVWVTSRNKMTPVNPGRDRQQDDQRIDERGELSHKNQVNQNDRQNQADAEALERLPHTFNRAAHSDAYVFRQLGVWQ